MMNLELTRLIKYEMTDNFLDEFKAKITSIAKERDFDDPTMDIGVALIDQLHEVPDSELIKWYSDKDGIEWETLFNVMKTCISNYITMRHSADGEWKLDGTAI
jgi:hypothetical protein